MEWRRCVLFGLLVALVAILVAVSGKSLHPGKSLRSDSEVSMSSESSISSESECSHSVSSESASGSGDSRSTSSSSSGCGHTSAVTTGAGDAGAGQGQTSPPATFNPDQSGRQVADVAGRRVSVGDGRITEIDGAGQPVPDSSLTRNLNFEGANWMVANQRAITNTGSRQITVNINGQLREISPGGSINVIEEYFVSGNQLFRRVRVVDVTPSPTPQATSAPTLAPSPSSELETNVPARQVDTSTGESTGIVRVFVVGPDGQVIREVTTTDQTTTGQPDPTPAAISAVNFQIDGAGRLVGSVGGRNFVIIGGMMVELDASSNPRADLGFGQNFNFGGSWSVVNSQAQADLGSRRFTIGTNGQLSEVQQPGGEIFTDRQFFVNNGQVFMVDGAGTGTTGGAVMARSLASSGAATGVLQSFTLGPDGQVIVTGEDKDAVTPTPL